MSLKHFERLLSMVKPLIKRKDTKFRKWISTAEGLPLTLRFLATGDSQQLLNFSFRIWKATVSKIISETCSAIYTVLKDTYLSPLQSKEEWIEISSKFGELWDMPHVIGCLDGKHIRIECPKLS